MQHTTPEPRKLARRENPKTSKDAAERVRQFAQHHLELILAAIRGTDGLTVHEIADLIDLDAHAVGKRMAELQHDGLVYVVHHNGLSVTRQSPSGRQARVWGLV